jgi:hypothetical protein
LKPAKIAVPILLTAALILLASCGGSSSSSSSGTTSKIAHRALVTNSFSGVAQIINADTDQATGFTITAGSTPQFMVLTPDKADTLVWAAVSSAVVVIDNTAEKAIGSVTLPSWTESIVVSSDSKTAYTAVRNAPTTDSSGNVTTPGQISVIDVATAVQSSTINVPQVRWLALSHNNKVLLGFSDVSNSLFYIDLTATTPAPVAIPGFDRPVSAFFSSDDSTAYVLNCGAECGGTQASVTAFDVATQSPATTVPIPGGGASVGLLDGTTLYVAGNATNNISQPGAISTFNASGGLTLTSTAPVPISTGYHYLMALAANNKLFIGAHDCVNQPNSNGSDTTGCLSIYDTSAKTAVVDSGRGFVTGMQPIPNRSVVYVVEGGELRFYDTTTNQVSTTIRPVDIVGAAFDVKTLY